MGQEEQELKASLSHVLDHVLKILTKPNELLGFGSGEETDLGVPTGEGRPKLRGCVSGKR